MHNWSTDTSHIKKNTKGYTVWKIEQLINFGLDGAKLSKRELIKNWDKLEIDPSRKKFLKILLWPLKRS